MDPLTAAFNLFNKILDIAVMVYKDTPDEIRKAEAANWGKFFLNIGNKIIELQDKINASIKI